MLGVLPGIIGSIQAVESDQDAARHRRPPGRAAARLRRARRVVPHLQGAPRPGLPGLRPDAGEIVIAEYDDSACRTRLTATSGPRSGPRPRRPSRVPCLECPHAPDRPAHTPRSRGGHAGAAGTIARADLATGQAQSPLLGGRSPRRAGTAPGPGPEPGRRHPSAAGQSHGGAGTTAQAPPTACREPPPRSRLAGRRARPSPSPSAGTSTSRPGPRSVTGWPRTRRTPWGRPFPALLSGVDLSMVNLESALTDGTCPPAAGEAVRLLCAGVRRQRVQGRRCDAHHGGQQPRRGLRARRAADGADHAGADRVHHPRHRPERGAGVHPVHDHHPRPAHRHHRRHPGHRLRPADGVDGHRDAARSGVGLRRATTWWPRWRRRARPPTP